MALLLTSHALRRAPRLMEACARAVHDNPAGSRSAPACRPPPPCAPAADPPPARRVVCRAPPAGDPPPCITPPPPPPRTCENLQTKTVTVTSAATNPEIEDGQCGAHLNQVALRLAAAERARRLDYERETSASETAPPADYAFYCLAAERATEETCKTVPQQCPIDSSKNCEIHRDKHLDPCAQYPRTLIEIDRSAQTEKSHTLSDLPSEPAFQTKKCSKTTEGLTTRIMEKFKRGSCATNSPQKNEARYKDPSERCGSSSAPLSPPSNEPSLVGRLCRRPGGSDPTSNSRRGFHTKVDSNREKQNKSSLKIGSRNQSNTDILKQVLHEKSQLKETGRGRIVKAELQKDKKESTGIGCLELPLPRPADTVRVRVLLDFNTVNELSNTEVKLPLSTLYSTERHDSWLSLKNIQKKILSGCQKQNEVSSSKTSLSGSCSQKTDANQPSQSPCSPSQLKQLPKDNNKCQPKIKFSSSDSNCVRLSPGNSVSIPPPQNYILTI